MPPRFAYWTILLDGQPTAFRAAEREELVPTLRQLQSRHPDAILRWFARGRLWDSPADAHLALKREQAQRRRRPASAGAQRPGPPRPVAPRRVPPRGPLSRSTVPAPGSRPAASPFRQKTVGRRPNRPAPPRRRKP
jgi:hypothetical protein